MSHLVEGRPIRQVAHVVHKVRSGQRSSGRVGIRRDALGVVQRVPSTVHGSTIRQVAHVIPWGVLKCFENLWRLAQKLPTTTTCKILKH